MELLTGRLLERGAELARLAELVELAQEGQGSVVVVEGPAGIGKTSLAGAFAAHAADAGLLVLRARRAARAGELEPRPAAVRRRERARAPRAAAVARGLGRARRAGAQP
jgi:replication-associated recombination protein RarA